MADTKGYIQCTERGCNEVAEVRKAAGTRGSVYTVCPSCKTNQANGERRQKYILENLKATREELTEFSQEEADSLPARPSKHLASGECGQTREADNKPPIDTNNKPKGKINLPPHLLAIAALIAAIITAIFAIRKPNLKGA